jgi:hypothetical protein
MPRLGKASFEDSRAEGSALAALARTMGFTPALWFE